MLMSIDAHTSLYHISVDKTVINEMDDITNSRNVHKNHTFLSILFESDEHGKVHTSKLHLYVANVCNL